MVGEALLGLLAGVVAGISPCIVPILPVVLAGSIVPSSSVTDQVTAQRRRALAVVAGLVLSFSLITALGSLVLSGLGLPQNLWHTLGIVLLALVGAALVWPRVEAIVERPFRHWGRRSPSGVRSGFALGLTLGLVFVPCAGPVLATVSVLGARHHASPNTVVLSFAFGVGVTLPLLAVALAGGRLIERSRLLATRARRLRPLAGFVFMAIALAIAFNLTAPLQRALPGYTSSLQRWIEGSSYATSHLRQLQGQSTSGSLIDCENRAASGVIDHPASCGRAPEFTGITAWLNTPSSRPLSLASLRGHVVLIDFWTYSCINCQRSIPHVEAWYERYRSAGLVVVGVASPEFAFEHVVANVAEATRRLGIRYPVAIDDNLATWNAYTNQYWPAEYLIDAHGIVRHVAYGEGHYVQHEATLRQLLHEANPDAVLPSPTTVQDQTPTSPLSPETYLGRQRSQYMATDQMLRTASSSYELPRFVAPGFYALGGRWHASAQSITAERGAELAINFRAHHVYLVMSGTGTVATAINGRPAATVHVAGIPTLYTLVTGTELRSATLHLRFTPGVSAYAFTFG